MLQLNGRLAHIPVEVPAQPALEEKGIYFSISRLFTIQPDITFMPEGVWHNGSAKIVISLH